jgi:hypothetical protein
MDSPRSRRTRERGRGTLSPSTLAEVRCPLFLLFVVPHLLHTLREYPRDWFWALHLITGADPVTPEERGGVSSMREARLGGVTTFA